MTKQTNAPEIEEMTAQEQMAVIGGFSRDDNESDTNEHGEDGTTVAVYPTLGDVVVTRTLD